MSIGNTIFDLSKIVAASPIGGKKFGFSTDEESFLVVGHERFNPLKYVLMFNKLDTKMKFENTDIYFNLEERKE